MIGTLKKNFEKILLAITLMVLLVTAITLYLKAGERGRLLQPTPVNPTGTIAPVAEKRYEPLFRELGDPMQWQATEHRLFIPPLIYKDPEGVLMVDERIDLNNNRIHDVWEYRFGMDVSTPATSEAEGDLDGDGFRSREEYLAGTDPTDPKSRPSYVSKLRLVNIESKEIVVQFLGLMEPVGAPAGLLFRNEKTSQQFFLQVGDMVEGFKVLQQVKDSNDRLTGVMIQRTGEKEIFLPQGQRAVHADAKAVVLSLLDGNRTEVTEGGKITLGGKGFSEEFAVKSIDTKTRKVIILDAAGQEHDIPQE